MDWKPIETAPQDGTQLLICDADGVVREAWFYLCTGIAAGWYLANTHPVNLAREVLPTHWMPLPALPERPA